jgi:DNA-binding Xre family transcriptional regulator
MKIEEKLQELILNRYHSLREFTIDIGIPYTTIHSIFRRGIDNSSLSNIIKICKALNISVDALAEGEIVFMKKQKTIEQPTSDQFEIKEIIEDTKDLLNHRKVTIDGEPLSKKGIESIIDAMEIGAQMAKKK